MMRGKIIILNEKNYTTFSKNIPFFIINFRLDWDVLIEDDVKIPTSGIKISWKYEYFTPENDKNNTKRTSILSYKQKIKNQ